MNKCLLTITVSALSLACSNFAVASPLDTSHIHTQHTLGLKPISSLADSFNLAAATFLPDAEDGFGFGSNNFNDNISSRDNCSGFALSSCPAHAKCLKCTFGSKYKITGCETDYKQSGNTCVAKNCSEINAAYKAEIPANQVCSIINTSVRTCYSSCRAVNTSGYPLDACPSGAVCTPHPDCGTTATAKGNCSPVKQKVIGCISSAQKVNSAATACIDKDDTCPATYYKSCDTGTQGTPKYTEKGSACYQCKATAAATADILYSDMTTSSELLSGKTPIGVVLDGDLHLAVSLIQVKKKWSTTAFNIPNLPDYTCRGNASNDWNGKSNTKTIIDYCKANGKSCPAAEYAYSFKTAGTKSGDWYLPSAAELSIAYRKRSAIDATLRRLNADTFVSEHYATSTEESDTTECIQGFEVGVGAIGQSRKIVWDENVVPVINYTDIQ